MESINVNERRESCKFYLSHRLQELTEQFVASGGEFTEHKIDDVFNKIETTKLKYPVSQLSKKRNSIFNLPAVTAGILNQGLSCYVPRAEATILKNVISVSANGANTGVMFYQPYEFTILQDSYAIKCKVPNISERQYLYLLSALQKTIYGYFDWTDKAGWTKIKNYNIILPTKNNQIDYTFMESYIRELEQERISELEQYLRVTGLDTYTLTPREQEILTSHAGGATHLFRIGDLFEKQQLKFKKAKFNKSSDVSKTASDEFDLPLVNAKDGDNGIMYYGRSCDFEYAENSIDIVNDGAVSTGNVYAQPQKTGVLYNAYLIKLKNYTPSPEILLFLAQTIQKIIKPAFGYDNKAGWEKVKKKLISLPIKNGEIDFEYMETYIRAIEKVVIRGVVEWKNKTIEATKSVVNA